MVRRNKTIVALKKKGFILMVAIKGRDSRFPGVHTKLENIN